MIIRAEKSALLDCLKDGSHKLVLRSCDGCSKQDWVKYYKILQSRRTNGYEQDYCKKCSYKYRTNKGGPRRDADGKIDDKGYKCYYIGGKKYLAHRMAAELMLRRKLLASEVVHHIDGDKLNNDWGNLLVCSRKEHAKLHAELEALMMKMIQSGVVQFNGRNYQINNNA